MTLESFSPKNSKFLNVLSLNFLSKKDDSMGEVVHRHLSYSLNEIVQCYLPQAINILSPQESIFLSSGVPSCSVIKSPSVSPRLIASLCSSWSSCLVNPSKRNPRVKSKLKCGTRPSRTNGVRKRCLASRITKLEFLQRPVKRDTPCR